MFLILTEHRITKHESFAWVGRVTKFKHFTQRTVTHETMQPLVTPLHNLCFGMLIGSFLLELWWQTLQALQAGLCKYSRMFVNLSTTHAHPRLSKRHLALMFADNRARPAFRTSVDLEEGMVSGPHLDHKSGSMVHMLLLLAWKAVLWSCSGVALIMLWACFGRCLAMLWACCGHALGVCLT